MEKINPCPRCGSENVTIGERRIGNRFVCGTERYIICGDCCFQTRGISYRQLIPEWNSLPPMMAEKKV